jgi:DNA-binding NarL/FixJ family response regulator
MTTGSLFGQPDAVLRTVLVCDDRQELRDVIRLVLAGVPLIHIVGEAFDGAGCLEQVRDLLPDVMILDVSMPGGGPEVARSAKEIHPEMQIVVFSGRQDAPTKNAMMSAGANEYVVKTGRLRPLLDALDRSFASSRS